MAKNDWQSLTKLTGDKEIVVERVQILADQIHIEGNFELPPLAKLTNEEQIFVASFVRAHGSIKEMERLFGISYPTVKSRLNTVSRKLGFLDVEQSTASIDQSKNILDELESGKISVEDAVARLKNREGAHDSA